MRGYTRHTHSGRLVFAAGGSVVVLCIALVVHVFSGAPNTATPQPTQTALALAASEAHTDTDNDGLYDWEEVLYKTDVTNPDTDNDGMSDGAEVREGRNPRGKDTSAPQTPPQHSTEAGEAAVPATLTQEISRELLGNYLATFQQTGGNVAPQQQTALAQSAIELAQSTFSPPTVDATKIRTVVPSKTTKQAYFAGVGRITEQLNMESVAEQQTLTLLAQQGVRTETLAQLAKDAERYAAYSNELQTLVVPQEYTVMHTGLVEALLQYGYTLETIARAKSDPMKSALGLGVFMQYESNLRIALARFAEIRLAFEAPTTPKPPTV